MSSENISIHKHINTILSESEKNKSENREVDKN